MKKKKKSLQFPKVWQFFAKMEWKIAIKTAVAAFLSLLIGVRFSQWLNRPDYLVSGTWCVLATFVVLQAHLGGTYKAAWIRFLGVLIGSIMGAIATFIFGSNPISLGISICLTVLILSALNIRESIRIACLSVSVVMILWGLHPEITPWKFGLFRFLDSTLGILIAVLVAHALWPAQALQKLRLKLAETTQDLSNLFQMTLRMDPDEKTQDLEVRRFSRSISRSFERMQTILEESQLELLTKTSTIDDWQQLVNYLDNIYDAIITMKAFQEQKVKRILDPHLTEYLVSLIEKTVLGFSTIAKKLRTRNVKESSQLRKAVDELSEELNLFRTKRTTSKFDRKSVEAFFVFFYHLRSVIEELLKFEQKIDALNAQPK